MGTLATCWPRARWSTCGDSTGPASARGGGDELGRAHGRAARRVDLRLAVRLDDLDRREERRGGGGERRSEHRAEREVGDEDRSRARGVHERPDERDALGRPSRRADEDVDAPLGGGPHDVDRHRRRGRVDHEVGAVELGEVRPRRQHRDELEVVIGDDHVADDAAQLACAAHNGHARRHGPIVSAGAAALPRLALSGGYARAHADDHTGAGRRPRRARAPRGVLHDAHRELPRTHVYDRLPRRVGLRASRRRVRPRPGRRRHRRRVRRHPPDSETASTACATR